MDKIIPSEELEALLNDTFGREGLSGWQKSVYKGTDCGAWITLVDPNTIRMGSIVEGVDEGAETHTLTYPFEGAEVWEILEIIEKDCERIWNDTHGCPECGVMASVGYTPINPDCPECEGHGISI